MVDEQQRLNDLTRIISARDIFVEKGGAQGSAIDSHGRICAATAVCSVTLDRVENHLRLMSILNATSQELFGCLLVRTNDVLGTEAVLQVFDKTIAYLEESQG